MLSLMRLDKSPEYKPVKATSDIFYNFCTNSNKWKHQLTADLSGSEVTTCYHRQDKDGSSVMSHVGL